MTSPWLVSSSSRDAFWVKVYRISKCGSGCGAGTSWGIIGCERIWEARQQLQTFDFRRDYRRHHFTFVMLRSQACGRHLCHGWCALSSHLQTASTAKTWNASDLSTSNLGWVQEGLCFFCFDLTHLTLIDFSLSSLKRLRLPSMRSRCSTEVLIVIWMVGIAFRSQQSWAASWRPKFWRWWNDEMYFNVTCFIPTHTSSTAQGGGGSFKKTKTIGEIDCCESWMSQQKHWPTD